MGWLFRDQETGPEKGSRVEGWLKMAILHPQRALAPSGSPATLLGPRDRIWARPYQSWHLFNIDTTSIMCPNSMAQVALFSCFNPIPISCPQLHS